MAKHLLIWLILLVLTPVVVPFIVPPADMLSAVTADYNAALAQFGDKDDTDRLVTGIYDGHLKWVGDFAIRFKQSNDDSDRLRGSGDTLAGMVADAPGAWADTLRYYIYGIALRLVILWHWLKWLSCPLALALVAGKLERRLKHDVFLAPNPPLYNVASHLSVAAVFVMLFWSIVGVWTSFYLAPSVLIVLSLALYLAIAHYP